MTRPCCAAVRIMVRLAMQRLWRTRTPEALSIAILTGWLLSSKAPSWLRPAAPALPLSHPARRGLCTYPTPTVAPTTEAAMPAVSRTEIDDELRQVASRRAVLVNTLVRALVAIDACDDRTSVLLDRRNMAPK